MSDVSADVLAEGWVVPEDIAALSVFSFARCFGFILQGELVSAFVDDGLAITNASPRDTENIKKEICRIFNSNGLRITIEANKQIINFLDVTFNLNQNTYRPFTKPNAELLYVHRESNHPPIATKNIPAGINKRLSFLSSDKASFDQAAPPCQKALNESGYEFTLQYEPKAPGKRKNRQRSNILWIYISIQTQSADSPVSTFEVSSVQLRVV